MQTLTDFEVVGGESGAGEQSGENHVNRYGHVPAHISIR